MAGKPPGGDEWGMRHYFRDDSNNGTVHVESILDGERWQHRVHTVCGAHGHVPLSISGGATDILTFLYDGASFYWTVKADFE